VVSLKPETKRRLRDWGGIATGVFVAGAGIASIPTLHFAISPWIVDGQAVAAFLGLFTSMAGIFIPEKIDFWTTYQCRTLESSELDGLHKMVARYAGGALVPIDAKIKIRSVNAECFKIIEEISEDRMSRKIVGYIMIYYLKQDAVQRVLAGQIHGAHVVYKDIVSVRGAASGVYIGFIWGEDTKSRAATLRHADILIRNIRRRKNFLIFTRPTTKEALAAVKRRSFKTVIGDGEPGIGLVCKTSVTALSSVSHPK
jgi:hypothetical protein